MSDEKVLTKEIAEVCLSFALNLYEFTAIEDAAAESLSKHEGSLILFGLTELSDAAAESLSKHEGTLFLAGLTELSDAAAESLSKRKKLVFVNDMETPDILNFLEGLYLDRDNLPASAVQILRNAGHG